MAKGTKTGVDLEEGDIVMVLMHKGKLYARAEKIGKDYDKSIKRLAHGAKSRLDKIFHRGIYEA